MAVFIHNTLPEGIGPSQYDAINDAMGLDDRAPEGLIAHTAGEHDGRFHIHDIWESGEHYDRFVQERLIPAQVEVFGQEMVDNAPPSESERFELHNYVVP